MKSTLIFTLKISIVVMFKLIWPLRTTTTPSKSHVNGNTHFSLVIEAGDMVSSVIGNKGSAEVKNGLWSRLCPAMPVKVLLILQNGQYCRKMKRHGCVKSGKSIHGRFHQKRLWKLWQKDIYESQSVKIPLNGCLFLLENNAFPQFLQFTHKALKKKVHGLLIGNNFRFLRW